MDEEKLILLVSNYPELYDMQNENYMNTTRKKNIWLEIANEIRVKDTVCKDKWKGLRDGFHRNVKKRKTKSGDPAKKNKKWKFERQMQFLLPYLQERATKSNLEDSASFTSNDIPENPELESVTSPLSYTSAESMSKTITARKKNFIQKQNPSVADVLQNYLDRPTTRLASQPENPISSFFKAMADTVITFPPELQTKAKNKIFALVSQIEYENFLRKTTSSTDQAVVVINLSNVSCEFEKQRFNPGPSTSTQRAPLNNQVQEIQIDSENIHFDYPDDIPDSDTCISILDETNNVSQTVLNHNATKYIITSNGRLVRRQ